MLYRPIFLALILLVGLAGCTPKLEVRTPLVEPRFSPPKAKENVQRMVVLEARTKAKNADGNSEEISGIPCAIKGGNFIASFSTPANVQLPIYGIKTSELVYECKYKGGLHTARVPVINATQQRIISSGSKRGLAGVFVVGIIASVRGNQENDEYMYGIPVMDLDGSNN